MDDRMADIDRARDCIGYSEVGDQLPKETSSYSRKSEIEFVLGLGEYIPYRTHRHQGDFMFKLAVAKRVYGRYGAAKSLLEESKRYLDRWRRCAGEHEGRSGTYCYSADFRSTMTGGFERIDSLLRSIEETSERDFLDFEKVCDFSRKWNQFQKAMRDTFYAHLAYYPEWLGVGTEAEARRNNCADCALFDAIEPPIPAFIALSAFFMPREAKMPDGTTIPEGISLHVRATEFHELHEHAHAYLHEKKSPGKQLVCEWIDEGIADWAAIKIIRPKDVERSAFGELYDLWVVINTMGDGERQMLIRLWCLGSEKVRWVEMASDAIACMRDKRAEKRTDLTWSADERCARPISISKYLL